MNNVHDIQTQAWQVSRRDLASLEDAGSAPKIVPVLPARDPEALLALDPTQHHPPVTRGMYSQLFWEYVRNPRNRRALSDATGVGESRFPRCGDRLTLYLNITDGRIVEASFEARACAPVIAVASLATERLVGLTLDEARELPILELDRELGGLPPSKRHAYVMILECIFNALEPNLGDKMSKNEKKEPTEHQKEPKRRVPIGVSFEVFPTKQPTPRSTQGQDSNRKENS